MAEMNLLRGTLVGKLGEITGMTWKGKPVIKARIFSKAPANEAQFTARTAFECLNRYASGITSLLWDYLSLSSKKMHRHNAIAKLFKHTVTNKIFSLANIQNIIPQSTNWENLAFVRDDANSRLWIQMGKTSTYSLNDSEILLYVISKVDGTVLYTNTGGSTLKTLAVPINPAMDTKYSLAVYIATDTNKGLKITQTVIQEVSGLRYSDTQQPTGDLWIDGRPIYQQSIRVTNLSVTAATGYAMIATIPNLGTITRVEYHKGEYNTVQGMPGAVGTIMSMGGGGTNNLFSTNSAVFLVGNPTPDQIWLGWSSQYAFTIMSKIITIRYTLTSDNPL